MYVYVYVCSVAALRQLHVEELAAVKERHKRNEEFEKIASEMKYTSGSIKLMEEHVCMYVCMYLCPFCDSMMLRVCKRLNVYVCVHAS